MEGDKVYVKVQTPKAPKLEVWDDYGSPAEVVPLTDARWAFKGNWTETPGRRGGGGVSRTATEKDAEVTLSFAGTGAIVVGTYLTNGGKLDAYVDGKFDRTLDVYPDEPNNRTREAVWHGFGLKNGPHTVRIVVRGETYPGSSGTAVNINDAVLFR